MHKLIVFLLAALPLLADDSFLGIWSLNVEKSEFYGNDARYKSLVIVWDLLDEKQLRFEECAQYESGKSLGSDASFVAPFHGQFVRALHETAFATAGDTLSLQVFDPQTMWIAVKDKNKKIRGRWIVSREGNELWITRITGGATKFVFEQAADSQVR
jgi:hypothetical protein